MLPFGLGRSYGDVCLNDKNCLLLTKGLDKLIHFNTENGLLRAESGVSLDDIIRFALPQGWFLPVTPGTKFVTLGGAIANDVHGKNHHRSGCFSHHVTAFELLRSSGERIVCSPTENSHWFFATIGGLGLTGLITWVEIKLRRVMNLRTSEEIIPFSSLGDFFQSELCSSANDYEYTVAWLDCFAPKKE